MPGVACSPVTGAGQAYVNSASGSGDSFDDALGLAEGSTGDVGLSLDIDAVGVGNIKVSATVGVASGVAPICVTRSALGSVTVGFSAPRPILRPDGKPVADTEGDACIRSEADDEGSLEVLGDGLTLASSLDDGVTLGDVLPSCELEVGDGETGTSDVDEGVREGVRSIDESAVSEFPGSHTCGKPTTSSSVACAGEAFKSGTLNRPSDTTTTAKDRRIRRPLTGLITHLTKSGEPCAGDPPSPREKALSMRGLHYCPMTPGRARNSGGESLNQVRKWAIGLGVADLNLRGSRSS